MNSADCLLGKMKRKRFMGPQGALAGAVRALELFSPMYIKRAENVRPELFRHLFTALCIS
jgi:hypothetical protein